MRTVLQQLSVSGGVPVGRRDTHGQITSFGTHRLPAQAREPNGARNRFLTVAVVNQHPARHLMRKNISCCTAVPKAVPHRLYSIRSSTWPTTPTWPKPSPKG